MGGERVMTRRVCLQVQGSAFWRIIHLCARIRSVYRWVDTSGLELGLSKQSHVVLCESSGGGKGVSASAGAPKQKQNPHQHGRAHVKAVWEGMPLLYGYMKKMGKTKGGMKTWARCRFQWAEFKKIFHTWKVQHNAEWLIILAASRYYSALHPV